MTSPVRSAFWHVWRIPLVLAALTVFGLLAALLGTGLWHVASWLTLTVPVVVACWFSCQPRSRIGRKS